MLAGRTVVGMQQHQSWLCEIPQSSSNAIEKTIEFSKQKKFNSFFIGLGTRGKQLQTSDTAVRFGYSEESTNGRKFLQSFKFNDIKFTDSLNFLLVRTS